jgi:alkylation response protein AidB-like acyl-CoA dehydrogenase
MTATATPAVAGALDGIRERAARVDRERAFPRESLQELARAGAWAPLGGLEPLALACAAIGGACASTGMVFLMHHVAAATIAAGGGPQAAELLEEMAAGRLLGTLAFSERGTGAHFHRPELAARRDGDEVVIDGRKSFVTSAGEAGVYLVLVASGTGEGLDCYAVRREQDGVSFDGEWTGLGMAGNGSVAMTLDGVRVSADALIGSAGGGADLVFGVVAPSFLVGLAAVNAGVAAAASGAATEHAASRRYADGSLLAEVQAVQHLLADMDVRVRGAQLLVRDAARLGDEGDEGALVAIMAAKVAATEAAAAVTDKALEACGGQGYTSALPVERYLRDARAGAVMAPTNGVLRSWIGRARAGLPIP